MNILINIVAFQLGWFACVLGGANQLPWLGTLTAVLIVAWHLGQAHRPAREFTLLAAVGALGALWDSLLVAAGWLAYPSGMLLANTAPHWIVAMWVLFASTLNVSLRWLRGRWIVAAALGAAGGPLAYYAGAGLDGVVIADPVPAFTALALGWAAFVPLLSKLSIRFDGMRAVPGTAGA
ncbi:MAG: DUF2878 domain-containing protein [Thiogranum sp.]|nr:DUF2878 domain-containing protein [Thiogranum sp.]